MEMLTPIVMESFGPSIDRIPSGEMDLRAWSLESASAAPRAWALPIDEDERVSSAGMPSQVL